MIIATLGPTGCGKTTLVRQIACNYGYVPIYEEFLDNPYVQDAYLLSEKKFENQEWFIKNDISRLIRAISLTDSDCIVDKLFIQNYVFVEKDSFSHVQKAELFRQIDTHLELLEKVDRVIYFEIPTSEIMMRIGKRKRDFESSISYEWIDSLNDGLANLVNNMMIKYPNLKFVKYTGCEDICNLIDNYGKRE